MAALNKRCTALSKANIMSTFHLHYPTTSIYVVIIDTWNLQMSSHGTIPATSVFLDRIPALVIFILNSVIAARRKASVIDNNIEHHLVTTIGTEIRLTYHMLFCSWYIISGGHHMLTSYCIITELAARLGQVNQLCRLVC